jgi:hypothetical protein
VNAGFKGSLARRRAVAGCLIMSLLCLAAGIYLLTIMNQFRKAHFRVTLATALSEYIGIRYKSQPHSAGSIKVPMPPSEWQNIYSGNSLVEYVNRLPPGEYRYFIYIEEGTTKFIMIDKKPSLVTAGSLDGLMSASRESD